jgi:TPR repeat protein
MLQPSATGEQALLSSKPSRVLDPEEIKLLMKQGEQLIAAGDVVTARVVLQRAAEVGNASAAMALGATYDPNVLAKLGVMGVSADMKKARNWYEKAETLGSPPPQILIYRSADGYKMKVESTSQAVWAKRLQRPTSEEQPKSGPGSSVMIGR